jgi:hypothetical protein
MSLLPREHGAYGQIAFPILTALLVAGMSTGGVLIATAVIAGFLAHEPAAVLLGIRGIRAKREWWHHAVLWLGCTLVVGVAAGAGALFLVDVPARWSMLVPLAPTLLLAISTARGRDKSWEGEVAASLAFSGAAMPISLAASAPAQTGAAVAIPFALLFVASTLAIRVVILRVRGGGNAGVMTATRRATFFLAAGAALALGAASTLDLLPTSVLVASAPGLLLSVLIAAHPPAPSHLRTLGWTLVGTSVLTAAIVVATV